MAIDWKSIVGTVAPTIATALGGPLAGLAVDAIGQAFSIEQPTIQRVQDALAKGQLTGEQILNLKTAEQNLVTRMRELDIQEESLYAADRDSARKREISVGSSVVSTLAFLIVGSFIALVAATLLGYAKAESVIAGTLIGYLSAKAEQVLTYYFGNTRGSDRKTELLAQSTPTKDLK